MTQKKPLTKDEMKEMIDIAVSQIMNLREEPKSFEDKLIDLLKRLVDSVGHVSGSLDSIDDAMTHIASHYQAKED